VLAAGMVMVLAALAVSTIGAAIVARHRAQQAADLAALAGAAYALTGEAAACARAAELVSLNGASLVSCRLDGPDLIVSAAIRPAGPPVLTRPATASARAGPVVSSLIGLGEGQAPAICPDAGARSFWATGGGAPRSALASAPSTTPSAATGAAPAAGGAGAGPHGSRALPGRRATHR
jgi:secretion/DNA translocation related TadE-like protein